jgi:hypothetical protein
MGGFGSGRRGGKDCTDDLRPLDVRKLQRQRLLTPGNSLTWSWSVNGDTTATINLLVELPPTGRDAELPARASVAATVAAGELPGAAGLDRGCTTAAGARGGCALLRAAAGA